MRKLDISSFRDNLKEELKNLPIYLTRYGRVVAVVVPPGEVRGLYNDLAKRDEKN